MFALSNMDFENFDFCDSILLPQVVELEMTKKHKTRFFSSK